MSDFIHVDPVRYWCHKILPLVYDDSLSYMELLNKVVYKLNELVNNNNELPAYIAEQIKNYINSGEIKKVVQDILANYSLNVKFPPAGITPAVGDGTADDTAAFQGCLDYANEHGGMMVFVPAGKYLCGNLTMYSGCSIKGDGRYDTTIVMRGGVSNPFIGGELDAVQIADIGIDGNADIQVNNVDVFNVKLSNALLTNLFLTDGYTLLKIQENGGDIQIDNIVFDKCVVRAVDLIKGVNSRVQMSQVICRNVSKLNGESAIRIGTDGGFYDNIISVANAPIGIEVTGNNNYVVGTVVNAVDSCKDTGENNNIKIVGEEENYTISGNYVFRANGDREVHVVGVDSVNAGSQNVVVNGDSTFRTSGQRTEQYDQSVTENITVRKTIKADTIFADTNKPVMYGEVQELNKAFKTVPMLDKNGNPYNLLVEGENINAIGMTYVTFEQFGAVGDGVTDDTTAIKAAVAEAENTGKGLAGLAKTYFVTDTIAIDCNKVKNINIAGTIKASFTDKTIVKFYSPLKEEHHAFIKCSVDGTNGYGGYSFPVDTEDFEFDNIQMVGIEFNGIRRSEIFCSAINCGIGILFTTADTGVVFNNVNIEGVYNCVIGLDLHPTGNGWVNSNNFYSGGFQIDSEYSEYRARTIAVRLKSTGHPPNNNVFIGTSFETNGLPILFDNAEKNHFIDCRNENKTPYIAKFINKSTLNVIDTLYGNGIPTKLGDMAPKNIVSNVFTKWLNSSITVKRWDFDRNKCFNCGAVGSSGSRTLVFDNDIIDTRKGPVVAQNNYVTINEDGLAIGNYYCIGALVDTSIVKTFLFTSDATGNIKIIPCDSSGTPIQDPPKRTAYTSNPWYEETYKCYQMSPPKNSYTGVVFGEDTKRAFIGFTGTLSYFDIRAVPLYGELDYGSGLKVYKISPDVGSYKIPGTNIDSKCVTGTMLPACDATGTALAYICTDGAAQTWVAINKPTA